MLRRLLSIFSGIAIVVAMVSPGNVALAAPGDKVTLCHSGQTLEVGAPALAGHLGHGDTEGPCAPEDVPIGEVTICHKGQIEGELDVTMVVIETELQVHLNHQDYFGECVTEEEPEEEFPPIEEEPNGDLMVTICHFPPLHPEHPETMEVRISQLAQFWQFGDHLGECEEGDTRQGNLVTICHFFPNHPAIHVTGEVRAFAVPHHLAHGDYLGACEEEEEEEEEGGGGDDNGPDLVTICHNEDGNFVTLEVAEAAVQAFLDQGDTLGACEDEEEEEGGGGDEEQDPLVTICTLNESQVLVTLEVLESELQAYLDLGATQGACEDEEEGGDEEEEGGDEEEEGGDEEEEGGDEEGDDEPPTDNGGGGGGGSGGGGSTSSGRGPSTNGNINLASEDDDSTGNGTDEDDEITLSETDDCEEPFDDVSGSYVYYSDVVDGYCNGEISGLDDGHEEFAPNQGVLLGHFIKMLVRGSGLVETAHVDGTGVDQYADVLEDEGHMDASMRDNMEEEISTEDAEELTSSVSGDEVEFDNTDRGYVLHIIHSIFGN